MSQAAAFLHRSYTLTHSIVLTPCPAALLIEQGDAASGGYGAGKPVAARGRLGWQLAQPSCLKTI